MTFQQLLQQLQEMTAEQLQQDVVVFDLHKGEGFDDVLIEDNMITFGQD